MAQVTVGQPMDTIKTRLQIEGPSGRFAGPMDCLRKTIHNEGFLGLYKGIGLSGSLVNRNFDFLKECQLTDVHANFWTCNTNNIGMASPLVGVAAVNALLFSAYSNLKKIQEPYPGGQLTLGQIGIAGSGAGKVISFSSRRKRLRQA